jgi:hypothetical protein
MGMLARTDVQTFDRTFTVSLQQPAGTGRSGQAAAPPAGINQNYFASGI